jgi:ABC-type transport system involved in multi-copper enzyme maturation permease subunit
MLLAIPLMAVLLFARSDLSPWYVVYVIVFNLLIGPVFSAGSVTGERERETLDLLLTTSVTTWQILWGKLIVGLRVSIVLTSFLLWPLILGALMVSEFYSNAVSVILMFAIVLMACVMNSVVAQFCSTFCRKTSVSLLLTYVVLLTLYAAPWACMLFFQILDFESKYLNIAQWTGVASPFIAIFTLPLNEALSPDRITIVNEGNLAIALSYFPITIALIAAMVAAMQWRLSRRTEWGE